MTLAVLHPMELAVYKVNSVESSYLELSLSYKHQLGVGGLHFTSGNMCYGPFGNSTGKDSFCIQGMDGQLMFYEQDHFSFSRQLEKTLVPGPIIYIPKIDSFITCASDMFIVSYKYQAMASADDERKEVKSGLSTAKRLMYDWLINIGEVALDIKYGRFSSSLTSNQLDIIVLGEHTLFCLKETGGIRFQKRLDYFPSAIVPYQRNVNAEDQGGSIDNVIVTSNENSLLYIYNDSRLVWSSKILGNSPVSVAVAEFGGLKGLICTLDDEGSLNIQYLGTDPPKTNIGQNNANTKPVNYEEIDKEHKKLVQIIRNSQNTVQTEPKDKINLTSQIPSVLDEDSPFNDEDGLLAKTNTGHIVQITTRLFITYTGIGSIENVTIGVSNSPFLVPSESSINIPYVQGGASTPLTLNIIFKTRVDYIPNDLDISYSACYTTDSKEPRAVILKKTLPLSVICTVIPYVTKANYKFDLITTKPAVSLMDLFQEMFIQPTNPPDVMETILASAKSVLTFQYYNGEICTVIVSKNGGKYRIQSSSLPCLWPITNQLTTRLEAYYRTHESNNQEILTFTYQDLLPLGDYFSVIDLHFTARSELMKLNNELNDRSHQFRAIQKRLLIRYKTRTPTPLNNLDKLLYSTFDRLLELAARIKDTQAKLKKLSLELSSATNLLLYLIKWRYSLDEQSFAVLASHLSPKVEDHTNCGWEEATDAAVTYLLKTALAKNAKEFATMNQDMDVMEDTTRLRKHIKMLCERLSKGCSLVIPQGTGSNNSSPSHQHQVVVNQAENPIPIVEKVVPGQNDTK